MEDSKVNLENYSKWDGEFGDLMTYEEFKECVDGGAFVPYDGVGYYAFESHGDFWEENTETDVFDETTKPTHCHHVIWYNR